MFSPIPFPCHKIMCVSRCLCPVGGQCWNTYYSLMLDPIRCHTSSPRPRRPFIPPIFRYDCCESAKPENLKFFFSQCMRSVCVCLWRGLECWVHSVTPGCDPQLQFSRSQEESRCAVAPFPSHTLTHALQCKCVRLFAV